MRMLFKKRGCSAIVSISANPSFNVQFYHILYCNSVVTATVILTIITQLT